ncbi:tetratricopeptide repeat protein [Chthonobacter albigriseus]|uniref:tetratricopeptide repeat protein n=1 Tax=Chthonobacter albigriseus TaxID=1683161 RepID=UPI0015EE5C74|nr:SEL1-like repeat protein [Chthonobacter albigriseus]
MRLALLFQPATARALMTGAALLAALPANAAGLPAFAPPDAASAKACVVEKPVELGSDWTAWDGGKTDRSRDDLLAIAREYAVGSARVARDPDAARRILGHLAKASKEGAGPEGAAIEARMLIATGDEADRTKAIELLREAMKTGSRSAARSLGDLLAGKDVDGAVRAYRVAAAQGDPRASLALARLLKLTGKADPATLDLAVTNAFAAIVSAVETGDCRAARLMTTLYTDGAFGEPRPDLAMAWTRFAAEKADSSAAILLAKAYHRGLGVTPDETKAVRYFEIAANAGRASALLPVGIAYATGVGVTQDLKKAAEFLAKAGEVGRTDAWYWLAQLYRGDFGGAPVPDKAYAYLVKAAELPDAPADVVFERGIAERDGFGTPKNPAAALAHLEKAADAGSDKGAYEAAMLVRTGADGVPRDLPRAVRLFRLAASNGSAAAAVRLSEVYRCGMGVAQSTEKAATWTERAAFLGSSSSMEIYARRLMASADPETAARGLLLLREAAQGGDADAAASMVIAYETGRGLPADAEMAARWKAHGSSLAAAPGGFEIALAKARLAENGLAAMDEARALFSAAETAGAIDARFELARALDETGSAEPQDLLDLLIPSAKAGHVPSMRKLGELLEGSEQAGGRSGYEWLQAAAAAGDFTASLALANGLPEASRIAELKRLAEDGGACSAEDFSKLGLAWVSLGAEGRAEAARYGALASETVEPTDGGSLMALADIIIGTDGDRTKAESYLRMALEAGEPKALRRLAEGLARGTFGPPAPKDAETLLVGRGDAGDSSADVLFLKLAADDVLAPEAAVLARVMDRIGSDLDTLGGNLLKLAAKARNGAFGEDGRRRANDWLLRAAEAGKPAAMRALAETYLYGPVNGRDPQKGIAWMQKAADAGDRDAKRALAAAYEVGFVVAPDATKARALNDEAVAVEPPVTQ